LTSEKCLYMVVYTFACLNVKAAPDAGIGVGRLPWHHAFQWRNTAVPETITEELPMEPGPKPLYRQVREYIETRVCRGAWPPDFRIPSENELVARLGVSRMTVNRALRELATEGVLYRVQGVGTFVNRQKPLAALLEIRNIADEIAENGGVHSSRIHLMAEESPPGEIKRVMGRPEDGLVFHVVVVHLDRGCPVQMADRYVNPELAPEFMAQDFTRVTPSAYLLGVAPPSQIEHVVEASLPDELTRQRLGMAADEPCLVLHRTVWSGDRVATVNRLVYPGSRYRIGGRFQPLQAGAAMAP